MQGNILCNEDIIKVLEKKYSLTDKNIKFINDFENIIYECEIDGVRSILRLSDSDHRNKKLIQAEVDFVQYLYLNQGDVVNIKER